MKKQQQQQQQSGGQFMWLCLFVLTVGGSVVNGADDLSKKCGEVATQVVPCLDFATGKEETPKKECCDATTKIKQSAPECLCYIIQETHKGSPTIKSMGIQEAKLLQLPSACNVKNANISDCPKLLGLSPSSPDAAIFTNASKVTPPAAAGTQTTTPQSQNASYGSMLRPATITDMMAVALAIVLVAIPTGFVSIYT